MSKQMQLIAAVIVIIIIAVVVFVMMKKPSQTSQQPSTASQQQTKPEESMTKGSIKSLLGLGKNTTCTISYPDNGGKGTVYVADKKMRGDFTMMANNKEMESHMIQDGTYGYFWSGSQGTKMSLTEAVKASPAPGGQQQGADIDKQVDLDCSNWSVDNSKFTVPTDVQFTDMTEMMKKTQQMQQGGGSGAPKMDSSYCDQITDPAAKAACMGSTSGQ